MKGHIPRKVSSSASVFSSVGTPGGGAVGLDRPRHLFEKTLLPEDSAEFPGVVGFWGGDSPEVKRIVPRAWEKWNRF